MFGISPIIPAFGRDYRGLKALEIDFNKGLDFINASGQAINKDNLLCLGLKTIQVRYGKLRKTAMIEIK